ncbi:hypothetical protein [Halomonas sp. NCCP-2165]|nr:hypothetical protein [Halomonas sp. NCCP-2165]GKW49739.1 hypothetical protein NCCP2165_19540 [Halomonas sp. NCCP-2165]
MLYFLIMGGLLFSVLFSVGWVLYRTGRWAFGGRVLRRTASKPRQRAGTGAKRTATRDKRPRLARPPGALARFLARLGSIWALTLLALLLYGGLKLAEHGMAASPRTPPAGFHELVAALGWLALALASLSVLVVAARWRCHGHESR